MKIIIFLVAFVLQSLTGGTVQAESDVYVKFDRPWFPQWENWSETSDSSFGYRIDGYPANLIIYGYNLDAGEVIRIENRSTVGRVISSAEILTNQDGWFYLRVETEFPDDFRPGYFYEIFYIRENGEEIKAGAFYIAKRPPANFHYTYAGNLTFGFSVDASGKPYLLSWLSSRDGPNILDTIGDRGREFQGDLVDGYPHSGDDWRWDTVVPCQGGGDYGRKLPTVTDSAVDNNYIYAKTRPLDYEPRRSEMNGPYRTKVLGDRWPDIGWNLETDYQLTANDVTLRNRFYHSDGYDHHVHQIRTAQVFLNPIFFQNPPLNDNKRDHQSYLSAIVNDSRIEAHSHALGIKVTFRAGVDGLNSFYTQRHWNYDSPLEMAEPGNVQVWETLNISEINRMVKPFEILSGQGKITITEADKLGINFDMEKFKRHLKMINEQRDYNW